MDAQSLPPRQCHSCAGPKHPCLHGPFDRCEHCVPDYWARVNTLQEQVEVVMGFTLTSTSAEKWLYLLQTLIVEAAELGITFEELIEE